VKIRPPVPVTRFPKLQTRFITMVYNFRVDLDAEKTAPPALEPKPLANRDTFGLFQRRQGNNFVGNFRSFSSAFLGGDGERLSGSFWAAGRETRIELKTPNKF